MDFNFGAAFSKITEMLSNLFELISNTFTELWNFIETIADYTVVLRAVIRNVIPTPLVAFILGIIAIATIKLIVGRE